MWIRDGVVFTVAPLEADGAPGADAAPSGAGGTPEASEPGAGRAEDAVPATSPRAPVSITVFTTRPDTLFGATFFILAPEHPLVEHLVAGTAKEAEAKRYVAKAMSTSAIARSSVEKEKTGVFTGRDAVNPVTGGQIPIYVADYVLMDYGTGAIMAVPGHDERDFAFASKFGLPIRRVITGPDGATGEMTEAYASKNEGVLINSGDFSGTPVDGAAKRVTEWLENAGKGKTAKNYRLRDWLISRQRYWGAPIPIIHCASCGAVPVPEADLTVRLPFLPAGAFEPRGDGRSPLANIPEFVNTTCPQCGDPARRETDTMGGFACSSWYFLRFASPQHEGFAFDPVEVKRWLPVDLYVGCLLYTSPSPRDRTRSRMPSSA